MYIVVGGGVVGLFSAVYLAREGADVVLVDSAPGGWSKAAAGVLEPTKFEINRINVRGYPVRYIKMWLKGKARIARLDWRWILTYIKVYGREYPEEIWNQVKELARFSISEYRRLAEEKNDFEFREEPLYEVVEDIEAEVAALKQDPLKPRFDVGEVKGRRAIVYLDSVVISTDLAVERLYREVASRGVRIVNKKASRVEEGRVVLEDGEILKGDGVIVAAGWWARRLGVPVAPLKGYGFRLVARWSGPTVADFIGGVFLVPFKGWIKATGRFDLDASPDHSPSRKVLAAAKTWLGDFEVMDMAVGYRPCAPDGLPVIERRGGVVVATGGCRLGWTLGPGIAHAAVQLLLGRSATALTTARFSAGKRLAAALKH
ncbi:D-proline dehydrogenase [Pyrobaculum calidifontis]|uniref:FAD dependent oxidoreductase n=1 Tax=Pyrobaculum calidifontis (strain DSM 21063 / JCM 11548 / VA1) TaxID=410359 RepID=A3MWV1_PYRCJ|nr:D-proline dehydrogenase [Pyrobaculum calidifontis]ABO09118.1 FAD dependent oxidoreductase [Pyrobaculum calidifontis JCM 11548]